MSNIKFKAGEAELREFFERFGFLPERVRLCTDKDTGASRGFAFVEFADEQIGQAAVEVLNGQEFFKRPLGVRVAEPRGDGQRERQGTGRRDRARW